MRDEFDEYREYNLCGDVTVRQLQKKLLEIFCYFKEICEKNNLRYWCGGGTMLGAIRHKGFIPWDDDLDVFMPRGDYEKLYEIWDEIADTEHYVLCRTNKAVNYHHTAMNLVDIKTTYVNKHTINEDIKHGIYIDIIPFEGCPKSLFKRATQIYHSVLYSVYNVQRLPDNQGTFLKLPTRIMLSLIKKPRLRYKIWKYHEEKMTKYDFDEMEYVKETITSFKGLFRTYPRAFFDTIEVPFENIVIKIPAGYDEYMKRIYGDYMTCIPPEERTNRYSVIDFIDLHTPFEQYKGIKYLK